MSASRQQQLLQILAQDIGEDCRAYHQLSEHMVALHELLMRRDSAAIEALNAQIETLIEVCQSRAVRRSKALAALNLGAGDAAMQALLARYREPLRSKLMQAWQQLGEQAAQCKAQNLRNGHLLAMQHEILQQVTREPREQHLYVASAY